MKNKLILWLVLLVVGFLAGFVPQYVKAQRVSHELTEVRQQLASCQASVAMSELRDTAAMLYLEATRKNYGTAGEYSSRLFERIQQVASQTRNPTVRTTFEGILQARDSITAALAKGDSAVLPDLQQVVVKLEEGTKR